MRLRYGVLADYAAVGAQGKVIIVGIFDSFMRIPGQEAVPLPDFYIAAALEASIVEGTEHSIEFRVLDADGHDVTKRITAPGVLLKAQGPGMPLRTNLNIKLQGLKLPAFGTYEFDVVIDGTSAGVIPVYVQKAPGSPRA